MIHKYSRRVCCDCVEFLARQRPLKLRVDAEVVKTIAALLEIPFSSHDMSALLGAEEYQVRSAIGWLIKRKQLRDAGERSFKSLGGCEYTIKLYHIVDDPKEANFDLLNRVFVRM